MARHPDEMREPLVVEIDDEFARLTEGERVRLTDEWLRSLHTNAPLDLPVSGAELVAEARDEAGW
jgi:hypothetical protein